MTRGRVLHVGASQTLDSVVFEQLRGLRAFGWEIVVACADDEWARRLRSDGFAFAPISLGRRPSTLALVAGGRDIVRVVRSVHPELVHTHNAHHGLVGRLAARGFGIPSIHTWRYNPLDASDRPLLRATFAIAEGVASRAGAATLFQNPDDLREATRRRLVPPDRVHLIGNGIHVEAYRHVRRDRVDTRTELGLREGARVVLCVARLEERKGQRDVISAVARARDRLEDLHLALVGTGPDEEELRAHAAWLGVGSHVDFLGQREDVPDLLHASDALVLASRREGVPRSVMEAMAVRTPVVATDVIGTREVARDGETALVVPVGAVDRLADAIVAVLTDRELAARLATDAAALIESDWREDQVVERVDAVYRRLLATPRGQPPRR